MKSIIKIEVKREWQLKDLSRNQLEKKLQILESILILTEKKISLKYEYGDLVSNK